MASGIIKYDTQKKNEFLINQVKNDIGGNYLSEPSFTQYPADWLASDNSTTFKRVDIIGTENMAYAPPACVNNTVSWYNVITFGVTNRCTQIALYSYKSHRIY